MGAGGEGVSSASSYKSEIPFTSSNPTFKLWVPISYHGQKRSRVRSSKQVGCKRSMTKHFFFFFFVFLVDFVIH